MAAVGPTLFSLFALIAYAGDDAPGPLDTLKDSDGTLCALVADHNRRVWLEVLLHRASVIEREFESDPGKLN